MYVCCVYAFVCVCVPVLNTECMRVMLVYLYVVKGIQEKLCFFTIHCNPSLTYIAVRDLQSSQRNESIQSLGW